MWTRTPWSARWLKSGMGNRVVSERGPHQARVRPSANNGLDFQGDSMGAEAGGAPTAAKGASSASHSPSVGSELTDWWLLYTHPTDPRQRSNLGVYLSPMVPGPATWSEPHPAGPGSCAYSDLQSMGTGCQCSLFRVSV